MADNKPNLLIIPGDGIGPEVIRETSRVIDWFEANRKVAFDITHGQIHQGLLSARRCAGLQTLSLALSFLAHGYLQKVLCLESIPN